MSFLDLYDYLQIPFSQRQIMSREKNVEVNIKQIFCGYIIVLHTGSDRQYSRIKQGKKWLSIFYAITFVNKLFEVKLLFSS